MQRGRRQDVVPPRAEGAAGRDARDHEMSEPHEPGLDELERELREAFASARPRPELRAELWERLRRRPAAARSSAPLQVIAGAIAAVLLVGFVGLLVGGAAIVFVLGHGHGRGAGGASSSAPVSQGAPAGAFGPLPAPAGAARADAGLRQGEAAAPTSGGADVVVSVGPLSSQARWTVYRYAAGAGIAPGAVLADGLPPGLPSADYPARPSAQAVADARA